MKSLRPLLLLFACAIPSGQSEKSKALFEKGVEQNRAGYLVDASVHLTNAIAAYADYALALGAYRQSKASLDDDNEDFAKALDGHIESLEPEN